jgi:glycosyltransferase involved in cell wall biosynthesis
MKILHTESSCGWGGQELRVLNEAAGMMRRGHEVLIAAPTESRIFEEASRHGVPVRALPIRKKTLHGLRAMRALLTSMAPSVVNTHSSTDTWTVALASVGLRDAPPLVRTRHISAPIPDNFTSRWLYRRATASVVTTGEALRLQVIREVGLDADRVTSVPTGIDLERFSPGDRLAARRALSIPGLPEQGVIIGIVATLRSWKGHRYLVDAMTGQGLELAHLLIVGDGPGRDNLTAQIAATGQQRRATMAGNQADVVPWLRAMDIFVLPSYANEGVPQALMQAMATGIPVVTTAVGAIGELVRPDDTGLVVTTQDVPAIQTALRRLMGDAALRERLSGAALSHVRKHCSQENMLERMEAVFNNTVARRAARAK